MFNINLGRQFHHANFNLQDPEFTKYVLLHLYLKTSYLIIITTFLLIFYYSFIY